MTPLQRLRILAKSKGEGSRGGKITGHTKSGRPIYAHESGRTFTAAHGNFEHLHEIPHDGPIDGYSPKTHANPATRPVIPLHDGYTAQHHITSIEPDEGGLTVHGSWKVHGQTGEVTGHKLDHSFLSEAQGVADAHKDYISEYKIPHPHDVGYHGQPSGKDYAGSLIDAGRAHLLTYEQRGKSGR